MEKGWKEIITCKYFPVKFCQQLFYQRSLQILSCKVLSAFIYLHRPACADGSRPQKPEKEGAPPQCEDGNTPVSQSWNGDDGSDIEKREGGVGWQCKDLTASKC